MSELLHELTVAWWRTIVPLSLQGGLLILAVALVDRLLPPRTWPELRAALWLLALLKLVLPPGLASPLSVVPEPLSAATAPAWASGSSASEVELWAEAAVLVWLGALAVLALGGAWRYFRLHRAWTASSTSSAPAWLPPLLSAAARRLGLRRVPEVRFSRSVSVPFVIGMIRPRIFLPDDLRRDQAEHVLLHELAHVRRHDVLVAGLCTAILLVYWFHPLVWWARRRHAALCEQCCDRTVTRALGGSPEGYRRTLLLFAARGLRRGPAGLGFLRPESLLVARLRQLEHAGADRPRLRRLVTAGVIAAMLVCCLPMARAADGAASAVAEIVERPAGCLRLRYMVLERLAQEEMGEADTSQPVSNPEETR